MLKERVSVLIVSGGTFTFDYFKKNLDSAYFSPVAAAASSDEARRMMSENAYELVVINAPLPDEFGTELAAEISEQTGSGVLMMVKNEHYESVLYKLCERGVVTVAKPVNTLLLRQSLMLLYSMRVKLREMERKTGSLEEKMQEIRLVNRAKLLLIERAHMSEEQAHKSIEKSAMDRCVKRSVIAREIIETYGE